MIEDDDQRDLSPPEYLAVCEKRVRGLRRLRPHSKELQDAEEELAEVADTCRWWTVRHIH